MTDQDDKNNSGKSMGHDKFLWELYTADIDPLDPDRESGVGPDDDKPKPIKKQNKMPDNFIMPSAAPAPDTPDRPAQIDKRTEMKLKRGQMLIDARLDLHGLYQKDAKDRLIRFIEQSYYSGMRCILVVTGKGKLILEGEQVDERTPGVIRRNFRGWLAEPPLNSMVLRAERAQIKDGGEGAFYVLLRKKR